MILKSDLRNEKRAKTFINLTIVAIGIKIFLFISNKANKKVYFKLINLKN